MSIEIITALIAGIVTISNVLLTALINWLNKRADRKYKETQENQKIQKQEFEELQDKVNNIAVGIQSLLRSEIIRTHEKWAPRKYCPVYAREALTRAYKAYHELGGNDVATDLYEDTMGLPTDPNDDEN